MPLRVRVLNANSIDNQWVTSVAHWLSVCVINAVIHLHIDYMYNKVSKKLVTKRELITFAL